jgi:phosphomannomutase
MHIGDLMAESGVGFGTSGARGLAEQMTDWVCYAYTLGFLSYLEQIGDWSPGSDVGLGGDLRPSTPRILTACARAVRDKGGHPVNLGYIPSPAVAAYGFGLSIPTLMVTGSHIPDDRNGIKFNLPAGEILKYDELWQRSNSPMGVMVVRIQESSVTSGTSDCLKKTVFSGSRPQARKSRAASRVF